MHRFQHLPLERAARGFATQVGCIHSCNSSHRANMHGSHYMQTTCLAASLGPVLTTKVRSGSSHQLCNCATTHFFARSTYARRHTQATHHSSTNNPHAPTHSSIISLPVPNSEKCCCWRAAAFLSAPVCTSSSWNLVPIHCSFRTSSISDTSACWDSTEPCAPIPCIRGIGFLDAVVHA